MNENELRLNLDEFVKHSGRFPTRREFRAIGSERQMYREFGGMSALKNWYNNATTATTSTSMKDFYINTLRSSVCIVKYQKNGNECHSALTLSPTVLKPYVGKGTSKKANPDQIFAYDVDEERFRCIIVSHIKSCIPLN
jgi:hypothetical protein